jgi:hypothetical protein
MNPQTVSILVGSIEIIGLLTVGIAAYFFPTYVAKTHRNRGAIFVLNLLLGWTFLGWVVALVWACTQSTPLQIDGIRHVSELGQ